MIKAKNIKDLEKLINNKKVFVCDFDGVVAHTEKLQLDAFNIVLEKYNVNISKEIWLNCIGKSELEIYKIIKNKFNVEFDEEKILKERLIVYLNLVKKTELEPFPTFMELLNKYSKMKFYILTSNKEDIVKNMLEYWNILSRFEKVISVSSGKTTKKDILSNTNEHFGVEKSDIVYLEDMNRNLKMAKELNITTIGIEHEFNYKLLENCDAIISGD